MVDDGLIYDIGLNDGSDTDFYLRKGFRVMAIEANPILYNAGRERFAAHIATGDLELLNVGIWNSNKTLPFYVNKSNDHWSSFNPVYGCREGTPFEVIEVPCLTISDILDRFPIPRYMKIDVEGADKYIIEQMRDLSGRPTFISVEEYSVQCIHDLAALGYDEFHIAPQSIKRQPVPPEPAREGVYAERTFRDIDSGLFGEEIDGPWLSYADAVATFTTTIRATAPDFSYLGPPNEWHDVHARNSTRSVRPPS